MKLIAVCRSRLRVLPRAAALLLGAGLLLAGCSPKAPPFAGTDISGASFGRDFALTDHHGQRRRLADFRGQAVVLFFGYTHCPDVCPTTMERFSQVLQRLGPADAARVQVIFVTLDPERDTREVLARYVPFFQASFLGLTGSPEEIAAMAQEFRVYYSKRPATGGGGYSLDHWAGAYAFDPAGRLRLYLAPELPVDAVAADLRRLLAG
jgi:protein SCO1/2